MQPRVIAALALVLAAPAGCYRSSSGPAPIDGRAAPGAASGPPPAVKFEDEGFGRLSATGLPAVSHDGTAVLIEVYADTAGAGMPNLKLVVRDRRDAEIAAHVVLTPDEGNQLPGTEDGPATIAARVTAANQWLTAEHAARRLTKLAPLAVEPGDTEDGSPVPIAWRATGAGGLVLAWKDSRLEITRGGARLHAQATPASWLVPSRPMYPGAGPDEICSNPEYLGSAYVDVERKLAVIGVRYVGTDSCWEPSEKLHVVSWQ